MSYFNWNRRLALGGLLAAGILASRANATTLVPLDTVDLSHIADVIVVGDVTSVKMQAEDGRSIRTHNEIKVVESWKGNVTVGSFIDVIEPGGVVNGQGYDLDGSAGYSANERVVVFLQPRKSGGYLTLGLREGKFTAVPGGEGEPVVTHHVVPMLERGQKFDAKKVSAAMMTAGVPMTAFRSEVSNVVQADAKAGIIGKELPQYQGIGR